MLASKNRLKRKVNFARVEIDGKMIQSKSFGMGIFDRSKDFNGESSKSESHFGFIISTKISKKAVVRNQIKRIMSDVIRKRLDSIKKGLDVVFLIKPSATKISRQDLEIETNEAITENIQINTLSNS